ncbi:MAG: glucose-1-phosphate adenylyltransferase [bacterium]|nr:glucose-1-phosphate adenylyltransferase [bacterium]
MKDVVSIILGGGRGQRLYPLTLQRSKPSVAFAGKYRLIDIPISNCINSGMKKIFVLTQFLSASMHRHIMQTYAFDGFTDGFVDILAAEQTPDRSDWYQGTSDAVRATLHHTMYYKTSQVLILGGDHLYRMDYGQMVRFHREMGADITLAVYPVTREDAPRMGLLRADATAEVTEFVEKPQDPAVIDRFRAPRELFAARGMIADSDTYLGSMGIYCFEPHVLHELMQDESKTDFGKEIIPEAIGKLKVMAYPFSGYWRDIGTIASFFEANLDLVDKNPPLNLHQGAWPFYTRTRALPPARIMESTIENSLVVEGATITGARIEHSIVGIRARIRKGAFLKDVIHMGADFYEGEHVLFDNLSANGDMPPMGVGRNCRLERCIIDKNARIGDGVIIRAQPDVKEHRDQYRWIRDGVTVIPKGTVIPPGTVL